MNDMKFVVGWRDRGHGHGDYGVLDEDGTLIAKVVSGMEKHARLLAASPRLLEGCKKALTCATLNSDVRALIESAIADTKKNSSSDYSPLPIHRAKEINHD